jgi:tRNA threonylcarbamoyladenosine biosynthesis protein TsaB
MLILTIRTDKPEAELGLYDDAKQLSYLAWLAHRELAETIHLKLKTILDENKKDLHEILGIVFFKGPGSFTGLRIGASVANALADALEAHIVGETGDQWLQQGIDRLGSGADDKLVLPEYGSEPHITLPRK